MKESKNIKIESVIKQTLHKKQNEEEPLSPYEHFLRNEEHLAAEAYPLEFRSLPRNLKVFFPGPPKPPPSLE